MITRWVHPEVGSLKKVAPACAAERKSVSSTKRCKSCQKEKPNSEFGWRYKSTPKEYQEARCRSCRSCASSEYNKRKRENKDIKEETADTECPCDQCFKASSCKVECASFRCWSEHGV